jgi:hypothetical protein
MVDKMRPQESSSPPIKFVPRRERHSPENCHSNSNDVQIAAKHHHNTFAKNPSSSGGARLESKSTGSSGGKAKPSFKLPREALNMTPALSEVGFSFFTGEQSASGAGGKESKAAAAKKTSKTKKDAEVS